MLSSRRRHTIPTARFRSYAASLKAVPAKDWRVAAIVFLNFFLIIACYAMLKPVRSALLVAQLGASFLPYLWCASGVTIALFVMVYNRLIDRFLPRLVVIGTAAFFLAVLYFTRRGLAGGLWWAVPALYIWCDLFSIVMIEQLWSLSDDLFKTEEAKCLYGLIGSGPIFGGIAGGALASAAGRYFRTEGLLSLSIALLVALILSSAVLAWILHRRGFRQELRRGDSFSLLEGFKMVWASRYLSWILAAVVLSQVISNIIDLQFNYMLETRFSTIDSRTAFLGAFHVWLNLGSLFIMLVVTPFFHNALGLLPSLMALPVTNLAWLAASILYPAQWTMFGLKFADKGLNYSINRATKELLYIPTSKEEKYKAKAVIDMFGYRVSEMAGAALVLPALRYLPIMSLGAINVLLIAGLIAVNWRLKRGYDRLATA